VAVAEPLGCRTHCGDAALVEVTRREENGLLQADREPLFLRDPADRRAQALRHSIEA
jgi:hypothetical protein